MVHEYVTSVEVGMLWPFAVRAAERRAVAIRILMFSGRVLYNHLALCN